MIATWIKNAVNEKITGLTDVKSQKPGMIAESSQSAHNIIVSAPFGGVQQLKVIIENGVGYVELTDSPNQING